MSADPFPLEAGEVEPLAKWFRATLANARRLRERQDHGGADFLIRGCARVFRLMREHGAMHGYSPDLLFADVRDAIEAEELADASL